MSFQYSGPGGNLEAGITWMVLINSNSSWVVITEMKLPSGCKVVETVELLSSMEAGKGERDNYGVKSGKCMRTVQVTVTLEQCEGEEPGAEAIRITWDCHATQMYSAYHSAGISSSLMLHSLHRSFIPAVV